jgi:hypothetical protein
MDETTRKLNALEQRVRQLENPDFLSDKLMSLLIAKGFIRINNYVDYIAGAGGNQFSIAYAESLGRQIVIAPEDRSAYIDFTVIAGTEKVYSNVDMSSYTGSVSVFSTGVLPSPLDSSISYFVINATSTSFELDDGFGTAITFTNVGVGNHAYKRY